MSNGAKSKAFSLPSNKNKSILLTEISSKYSIIKDQAQSSTQFFYDTFDWRLYNKNYTIFSEDGTFYLKSIPYETLIATAQLQKLGQLFWWDFPDGELKNILKNRLDVRAILPLAQIRIKTESFRVLNKDAKTVLFFILEEIFGGRKKIATNIKLQPLKGYSKECDKFCSFLESLKIKQKTKSTFSQALAANSKQPGDYSSKLNILLEPDLPAHVALSKVLNNLLDVMRKNESGIKDNYDTEFLHDFRVAIRRTRSALTQLKGIFDPQITNRYKRDFSKLAKSTNRMRDLDVYLLNRDKYLAMLPQELTTDLEPMFEVLARHRIKEHQKVVKMLDTYWFKNTIKTWGTFLNHNDPAKFNGAVNFEKPIIDLAKKSIWKKYKKIIKAGTSITRESPDEELHNLRIECKKLRYLIEFFTSLFPPKEVTKLIKQMQRLQDNLGEFNDLYIQQTSLQSFISSELKYAKYQKTNIAIGGLIAVLSQKQRNVRSHFKEIFAHFCSEQNSQMYQRLFK